MTTKPRGWHDTDVEAFRSICKLQKDDNIDRAREHLLLISKGNIPASFLVDMDGRLFPMSEICSKTIDELKRFTAPWRWQRANRTKLVKTLKEAEMTVKKQDDSSPPKKQLSPAEKRAKIMAQDPMALAIHFFAWDGKPRDANGIDQARKIEAYSLKKTGMTDRNQAIVITAFVTIVPLLVAGGVGGVAGYKKKEVIQKWWDHMKTVGVPNAWKLIKYYANPKNWGKKKMRKPDVQYGGMKVYRGAINPDDFKEDPDDRRKFEEITGMKMYPGKAK